MPNTELVNSAIAIRAREAQPGVEAGGAGKPDRSTARSRDSADRAHSRASRSRRSAEHWSRARSAETVSCARDYAGRRAAAISVARCCSPSNLAGRQVTRAAAKRAHSCAAAAAFGSGPTSSRTVAGARRGDRARRADAGRSAAGRNSPSPPPSARAALPCWARRRDRCRIRPCAAAARPPARSPARRPAGSAAAEPASGGGRCGLRRRGARPRRAVSVSRRHRQRRDHRHSGVAAWRGGLPARRSAASSQARWRPAAWPQARPPPARPAA